jgi:16S rRNA A1518/A1519 N6-dimethyltransferase RsmA/KsgA/DIM1 with predicted DNA glycosylase/AP lyase activity
MSGIPEAYPDYSSKSYWNARYTEEKGISTDWLVPYDAIQALIQDKVLDKNSEIFHIGCGNSSLAESLYNDGYKNITSCDFSKVVIDEMSERYKQYEEMEFMELDITEPIIPPCEIDDEDFEFIIEKGTLDSVLCHSNALTKSK